MTDRAEPSWGWARAILALTLLALLVPASRASADVAIGGPPPEVLSGAALFHASSADGRRVVFSSRRRLARDDRDRLLDVYLRAGGRTTLLSRSPVREKAEFVAATPDARTVLVGEEGPLAGTGTLFALLSTDGRRVFLLSEEQLLPEDEDDRRDVYERRDGRLRLVSPGTPGSVRLHAIAADGSRVVVSTNAGLDPGDVDGFDDIYSYGPEGTTLISAGGLRSCPGFSAERERCEVEFAAASDDATRVYFETADSLSPLDADLSTDVYRGGPGGVALVSAGPGDALRSAARLGAISADGRRVLFVGGGPFAGLAPDTYCGLYERRGGRTALISEVRGKPVAVAGCDEEEVALSEDGSAVVFPNGGGAQDRSASLYRRQGGRTTLVSGPPREALGGFLKHVSSDGSRVAFLTWKRLVRADIDGGFDLYTSGPRGFTLLTLGPAGGNGAHFGPPGSLIGDVFPQFGGASADGRRVFFSTQERLLRRDRNEDTDLYERGPAGLRLVSTR
ncbi:MAG TPA: hypothetical protein VFX85_09980 [Solirubrobacterales bacterium]|nr:hypothetical protein [Solirubrobacterales bacterium]